MPCPAPWRSGGLWRIRHACCGRAGVSGHGPSLWAHRAYVQLWLARTTKSSAGAYAIDPVCGMQVQTANAPAHRNHNGHDVWFCADRCAERFDRDPEKYLRGDGVYEGVEAEPQPVQFLSRKPPAE